MAELLAAEWALGEVEPEPPWMSDVDGAREGFWSPRRGSYYEFHRGLSTVEQVSFIYKDKDRMAGWFAGRTGGRRRSTGT